MWRTNTAGEAAPITRSQTGDGGRGLVDQSLHWVDDLSDAVDIASRMWRSEVDRRTLLAAAAWVPSALVGPFRSWVASEPDVLTGAGGRRVGQAEVDMLWSMCASFAEADHRLGGGYARSTLIHYLDTVVSPVLRHGQYGESVGRSLMAAAARLCDLCAFMSFDSGEQGLAQRYFVQALRLAHASDNRALGAHVLGDMSMQAHHLGYADRALELAEAGYRAGVEVGSPSTAARCAVLQGRAHALRGDSASASRSRLLAEHRLDASGAEGEPGWIQFFTPDQLMVEAQYIAADLGQHDEVKRATPAISHDTDGMQRRRVLSTVTLAGAYLPEEGAGTDLDRACELLTGILPTLPALTSARARDKVDHMRSRLLKYQHDPGVREFEDRYENVVLASG